MPIIREEQAPLVRGTRGKVLSDLMKINPGQCLEYEKNEFDWRTWERFKRSMTQYCVQFRKEYDMDIKLTWTQNGFKIFMR